MNTDSTLREDLRTHTFKVGQSIIFLEQGREDGQWKSPTMDVATIGASLKSIEEIDLFMKDMRDAKKVFKKWLKA